MKKRLVCVLALCLAMAASALADDRAEALLTVAMSELGYRATKGGYTKFGEWGGSAYGEWCSEFVSWCVNTADNLYDLTMLGNDYPMQTSCEDGAQWFRERGRYVSATGEMKGVGEQFYLEDGVSLKERPYVPQRGDLVYIEWYQYHRLDHVGIVEFVTVDAEGSYFVHTIEGNNHILGQKPTAVARYTYALDDDSIRGYGILNAGVVGTRMSKDDGSSGGEVIFLQQTLKDLGYYDGDCAGKFGKATASAVKKFQKAKGIPETGVADAETLRLMTDEVEAQRIAAQERAKKQAADRAKTIVENAKEALANSWFGEFDPYDEENVWKRLTADIVVMDVDQKQKIYLSDAPNGKRKTYDEHRGFVYGESAAVKVLEKKDDWVKIEIYNDCDELEQGWVRAKRIKTVTPNQEYGIVVDKMAQRLYLYREGKLLTTLLVSTGTTKGVNEDYNETASGEYLMCSATGGFWAGNLWCNYAIRFNGGDLIHLVPSIFSASGREDFSMCESALGSKASHGCVRVQRLENEDGYNHLWIWNNLRNIKNIKLIVWDDDGRRLPTTDPSTAMYYNPNGGKKYHTTAYCQSVRSTYLPLTGISYGELDRYPYTGLTPCGTCAAPERPEIVAAWNEAIDQASAELAGKSE